MDGGEWWRSEADKVAAEGLAWDDIARDGGEREHGGVGDDGRGADVAGAEDRVFRDLVNDFGAFLRVEFGVEDCFD